MPNPSSLSPSIMSHVSIGTNDFPRAKAFYDAVLATLQIGVVMEHPGAVAYGREFPEFWVQVPHDGGATSMGTRLRRCTGMCRPGDFGEDIGQIRVMPNIDGRK